MNTTRTICPATHSILATGLGLGMPLWSQISFIGSDRSYENKNVSKQFREGWDG